MAKAELRPAAPHHILLNRGRDGKRQRNELSFHCLRHTAVTLLKEAGVPQAVTMALIGHDSPEISQHYTHVGDEALKKACATLPAL
jgi:integrase